MIAPRPVGRDAASKKYDLLTMLGAHALAQDKARQRLTLRLLTLITARYNWRADELVVGRREMARLWCVDERTVKREMAKIKALGWIEVKRPGARGRITSYRLLFERILRDTQPEWQNVGPDFEARMTLFADPPKEDAAGSVVPFPGAARIDPPDLSDGTEWSLAQATLHGEDAQLYAAWIKGLTRDERVGDRLHLRAPSRFHAHYVQTHLIARITAAVRSIDDGIASVSVLF